MLQRNGRAKPIQNRLAPVSLIVAALVLSACGGSNEVAETKSGSTKDLGTLKVLTSAPNLLQYVGFQEGTRFGAWDGSGVKVEVKTGSPTSVLPAMASGAADVGVQAGNRIGADIAKGLDATMVAGVSLIWDQIVVASADTTAKSVKDLKGKKFGVSGFGSGGHYATEKIASKLGWSKGDYEIVQVGGALQELSAALKNGSIDAFLWSPQGGLDAENGGFGKIIDEAGPYVGTTVFNAVYVRNEVIKERPEAVKAFFKGYFDTVKKLREDRQQTLDIMVKQWGVKPDIAEKINGPVLDSLLVDGCIPSENLEGLKDAIKFSLGDAGNSAKFDGLYRCWKDL